MASVITVINKITKAPFMEKCFYKPARENPAKFAGQMALLSALTKDAVNCYYYTTQSLNNEKIPEEKRGFVASLDLMNGILNVGLQFTLGKWIEKHSEGWFDKLLGKQLNENKTSEISKKLESIIKSKNPQENISMEQISNYLKDKKVLGAGAKGKYSWLKIGFSALVMLVGTQIICKRIFTPLLATPLAGTFKKKFLDKNKKTEAKPDEKMIEPNYKPWLDKTADNKKGLNQDQFTKTAAK